jgi:hypothetical protein
MRMGMESTPTQGRLLESQATQKQDNILHFAAYVLHVFRENCLFTYKIQTETYKKFNYLTDATG